MTNKQLRRLEQLIVLIDGNGEYSGEDVQEFLLLFRAGSPKELNTVYEDAYHILGISTPDEK